MTIGNKHTNQRYIAETTAKQTKAMELLIRGATYEEIAEQAGYSDRSNAHSSIKNALQKRARERDELADVALTLMLERIDRLLHVHYLKAIDGDHKSTELVLKMLDRQAKLLGLDAGVTVTVQGESLLDRELVALTQQMNRIIDATPAAELPGPDADNS